MQNAPKADGVAAVLKVFAVLEALAEAKALSLGDIARTAVTSKSTAHRLLQTMQELGYVEQEGDTDKYRVTLKLYSLGSKVLNRQTDLVLAADRAMAELSRRTGEAVHLGVIDEQDDAVVYVHKYDSTFNLCMHSQIGRRNPLYSTALGKALLAWRDEADLRERLPRLAYRPLAPNTITDAETLSAQLRRIRALGVAEEAEESEAGVRCMAVPVFDRLGRTAAAISISFPVFRFDQGRQAEYVAILRDAGREVSETLGFQGSVLTRVDPPA